MGAPGRRRYEQAVGLRRLLAALFLLFASHAAAQPSPVGPQPPCGTAPAPSMPVVGAAPAIQIWHDGELERIGWQPPSCTGWLPSSRSKLLVALAGRFRFEGTIDDLVARKGAISTLRGIKYWSATEAQWRTLVIDAAALSGPDAHSAVPISRLRNCSGAANTFSGRTIAALARSSIACACSTAAPARSSSRPRT